MQHLLSTVVLALSLLLQPATATNTAPNTLTAEERAAGWQLLFDGRTLDGWRGYRRDTLPETGWEIKDGILRTLPKVKGGELMWRVPPGGNNGVNTS